MTLLIVCLGLLVASGVLSLMANRSPNLASVVGAAGVVLGAGAGLWPAVTGLWRSVPLSGQVSWGVYGDLRVEVDPLSAFFLVPILVLSGAAALYGVEYLRPYAGRKSLGVAWLAFNLLVASMVVVVVARHALLFLLAWEVMALSSFFLVTFESEKESVREAGWIYLVATHLGTAFLFPFFLLFGVKAGTLDFSAFPAVAGALPGGAGLAFALAVVGFGTKAGFMPLHVWLPEAHPAAPSHVSAVMSGVMIKTGVYGLLRALTFLGPPSPWWGWLLLGVGLVSGVLGILLALAQRDLKRLLAYSSVENVGIITVGVGLGVLGVAHGMPALAVLGLAGGLLHVLNHALFKGLLFLGAGVVLHGTGTRDLEQLGGLQRRMRWTGACFLVGALAICGLPPLNGFMGELLLYAGVLGGATSPVAVVGLSSVVVLAGLALTGGLATACFTKVYGVVFLGEPRSDHAREAHEAGPAMRAAMLFLAAGCVLAALLAPTLVGLLQGVVGLVTGLGAAEVSVTLTRAAGWLAVAVGVTVALLLVAGVVAGVRLNWLERRGTSLTGTWDCGYAAPSARMQYTASSFADPLVSFFFPFLRTRRTIREPMGYFPPVASLATHTPDLSRERLYGPAFLEVRSALARLHWLQGGGVHLYVLFVAITLVALLVWKL
jgi:formate hydrogenlyase subunit 3/multisubunit Na+/H+ antiporter MnhD subunit